MYTVVHAWRRFSQVQQQLEQTIAPHVTRSIGLFSTSKHKGHSAFNRDTYPAMVGGCNIDGTNGGGAVSSMCLTSLLKETSKGLPGQTMSLHFLGLPSLLFPCLHTQHMSLPCDSQPSDITVHTFVCPTMS